MVVTHTQKVKVTDHSVQKLKWKEMDGWMEEISFLPIQRGQEISLLYPPTNRLVHIICKRKTVCKDLVRSKKLKQVI